MSKIKLGRIKSVFKFVAVFLMIAVFAFSNLASGLLNKFGNLSTSDIDRLVEGLKVKEAMAATLQYVGSSSCAGTGATYSCSLTTLTGGIAGVAATGDLVIVVTGWSSATNGDPGVTTPTGYTEVYDLWSNDTRDANLSVNWKIMGATPDTSVTISGFNNAANGGATVVHVWRGADQTTPMDVTPPAGVVTPGNQAHPNSPSITPVTSGAVVLTVGGGTGDAGPLAHTAPTGYGNTISATGVGSTMSFIADIASKAWSGSGAEDPAVWTGGDVDTNSDSMAAGTLAIRPANDPPTLTVTQPDGVGDSIDQGLIYNVEYSLSDPDNIVTVALYYDTDNTGLNGIAISGCGAVSEGTATICPFDTTGVTPGSYYIYGITNDGVNPQVSAYSPGQITINSPPSVLTVGISGSQTADINSGINNVYLGGAFGFTDGTASITAIKISNNGTAGNLSDVRLYYDTVGDGYGGGESCFNSGGCADGAGGTLGSSIAGSLSMIAGNTYYVYVVADIAATIAGGLTVDLQITNPSTDITTTAINTDTVAKNITGSTTIRPNITSITYPITSPLNGSRIGQSITINGAGFGTTCDGTNNRITIGGAGNVVSCTGTTFSNTSISITNFQYSSGDSYGGAATLLARIGATDDDVSQDMYVYPDIVSLSVSEAREGDTVTINGNHFGTGAGANSVTIDGVTATGCTWSATSLTNCVVPTAINDANNSVTVRAYQGTGGSNSLYDDSTGFGILPKIDSISAASFSDGGFQNGTFTLNGSHFGASPGSISVNGQTQDGTPIWGVSAITGVGIPDTGTDSGNIILTRSDTKTSNTFSTFYIYPQITSFTAGQGDGDVQSANITITGNHFGTGGTGVNILINGANPSSVTWTSSSSLTAVDIPNAGADSGVIVVTNPTTTKSSNNSTSFYIYPQISSLTVPTATPDAAREYLASDTDGIITVNGNHFGVAGSVTALGSTGTQQTTVTCSGSAYQATCTGIQIPTAIANNSYTGNIILTRTADTKTNTYAGFRVLPRIASTTPVNLKGGRGDTIAIAGDHLCQSGTCPSAFSATNKVSFNGGEVTSGASAWTDTSIPSIVIPGTAIDGNLNITSNTSYISNNLTFDIKFSPTSPTNGDPAGLSDVVLNPILNGSVFSDGTDGDSHFDSDWQIDEEGTFAAPEWAETLSSVNISITVNNTNGSFANNLSGQTALACSKTYSFRARYKDNAGVTSQEWSSWSTTSTFNTALCGPNATSVSDSTEPALTDGGRIGHTIVISGSDFGTVSVGNRATCTGNGNGCVKIGGTGGQMIADTRVTAWANTSITISLSLTDLTTTYGGTTTSGLIVYRDGVSDASGLTFYVYPDITSLTAPLGTNDGAREYAVADSDGIITITGNKFGTGPTGGQTVIVGGTVATYVADGACDAVDGWAETCIKVQVPATISDSTDSGYAIITQGTGTNNKASNSTDAQSAINIWPRVTGFTGSQSEGGYQSETFTLSGNHFGASAGSISVNGQTQDGTPTWGAASITGVGIPNAGTDSGSITLTKSDAKTSNTFSTFYIYPQITDFTAAQGDGDVQTATITITGNHFGAGGGNTNITINGVAPSATIPTWGAGSITTVDIPNTGTDSGVIVVTNPTTTKSSNNSTSFYIYPQISSLTVPTATPEAAREYLASDIDGIITVNGNHFGATGSVTVFGSTGTQQTTGTCSGSAYQATCTGIQIPTAIADSSYTGNIVLTRTADTKTNTYSSFRVLPRIISLNPNNGITNDPTVIIGNHFCQTGTCPLAGSRSTASDNATFYNGVQVTDGNVTAWGHGDSSTSGVNVNVPAAAITGNVVVKSNNYDSNGVTFTKQSSVPNSPTGLNQYRNDGTTAIAVGNKTADGVTNNLIFKASMTGFNPSTLCLQVENAAVGTAFTGAVTAEETGGNCESYTGTPVVGSVTITGLIANTGYHWRARVRNNGTGETGSWVAFGANPSGDGSTDGSPANNDYYIDATAPVTSVISSTGVTASGATITWNTDELADSQVKYDIVCPPVANSTSASQTGGVYSHSVALSNLTPGITYQYQVVSQDRNTDGSLIGNSATGPSAGTCNTFLTSQANMRTAEFIITGETSAATAETIKDFQVYITEQGYSIQNAFIETTGIAGTGGGSSMTLGLKVEGETGTISYTNYTVAIDNAIATPFTILHKIDNSVSDLYIAPTQSTQNKLYINPSSGDSVYIASAKIVVTYYYTPQ